MSANAWKARRLGRRLDMALKQIRKDPNKTVMLTDEVAVVSYERYARLREAADFYDFLGFSAPRSRREQ